MKFRHLLRPILAAAVLGGFLISSADLQACNLCYKLRMARELWLAANASAAAGKETDEIRQRAQACRGIEGAYEKFDDRWVDLKLERLFPEGAPSREECREAIEKQNMTPIGGGGGARGAAGAGGGQPGGSANVSASLVGLSANLPADFLLHLEPDPGNPPGFSIPANDIVVSGLNDLEVREIAAQIDIDPAVPPGTEAFFTATFTNQDTGEDVYTFGEFSVLAVGPGGGSAVETILVERLSPVVAASNDSPATLSWRLTNLSDSNQVLDLEIGPVTDPLSEAPYLNGETYDVLDFFIKTPVNVTGATPLATPALLADIITPGVRQRISIGANDTAQIDVDLEPGEFCENAMMGCCPFRVSDPDSPDLVSDSPQYVVNTSPPNEDVTVSNLEFIGRAETEGELQVDAGTESFVVEFDPQTPAAEIADALARAINAHPPRFQGAGFPHNALFGPNQVAITGLEPSELEFSLRTPDGGVGVPGLSVHTSETFEDLSISIDSVQLAGSNLAKVDVTIGVTPNGADPSQPILVRLLVNESNIALTRAIFPFGVTGPTEISEFLVTPLISPHSKIRAEIDPLETHRETGGDRDNNADTVDIEIVSLSLVSVEPTRIDFQLGGEPGAEATVEISDDLNEWEPIASDQTIEADPSTITIDEGGAIELPKFGRAMIGLPPLPYTSDVVVGESGGFDFQRFKREVSPSAGVEQLTILSHDGPDELLIEASSSETNPGEFMVDLFFNVAPGIASDIYPITFQLEARDVNGDVLPVADIEPIEYNPLIINFTGLE